MNKAQKQLKEDCDLSLRYNLENMAQKTAVVAFYQRQIEELEEKCPKIKWEITPTSLFIVGANRNELMTFLQVFGGEWKKEIEDYYPDKMRYVREEEHPFDLDEINAKIKVGASQVDPPPSCKVEDYEVIVPERKEIRKRIVCPKPEQEVSQADENLNTGTTETETA